MRPSGQRTVHNHERQVIFMVPLCAAARYTQVDGQVVKPGGARSKKEQMEHDRPRDLLFVLNSIQTLSEGADSRFAGARLPHPRRCALFPAIFVSGRIDTSKTALSGNFSQLD
jgi:hypothetical protein